MPKKEGCLFRFFDFEIPNKGGKMKKCKTMMLGIAFGVLFLGVSVTAYAQNKGMYQPHGDAAPAKVKAGAENIPVMDFYLKTDNPAAHLNAMTFTNNTVGGTADTIDIEAVKLWYESGDTSGFDAADNYIETAIYYDSLGGGDNWYISGLSGPTLGDSLRFYVTVDIVAHPRHGKIIQMRIPKLADHGTKVNGIFESDLGDSGIFVSSQENGPATDFNNTSLQTIDTLGPVCDTAWYDAGSKILTAHFGEGIDSTYVDPSKFIYWSDGKTVALTGADILLGDKDTVKLKVTKAVDAAIVGTIVGYPADTFATHVDSLKLLGAAVCDTAIPAPGNPTLLDTAFITYIRDDSLPNITKVTYDAGTKVLEIKFDEYVTGSSVKAAIKDTVIGIGNLGIGWTYLDFKDTLGITPTDSLDVVTINLTVYEDTLIQALAAGDDSLRFYDETGNDTTRIMDLTHNEVADSTLCSISNIDDIYPPTVDSVSYNAQTSLLTIYCNEVVKGGNTDFRADSLLIHSAGLNDTVRLTPHAKVGNRDYLIDTLTNYEKARLQNMYHGTKGTNPQLNILQGAFKDYHGKLVDAANNITIKYTADATAPVFDTAYYNGSLKELTIGFDDPVDVSNVDVDHTFLYKEGFSDTTMMTVGANVVSTADTDRVVLKLSNDKAAIIDGWGTNNDTIDLGGAAVYNLDGWPTAGGIFNLTHVADDTCPKLVAQQYDGNTKILTLWFDEYVKYDSVQSAINAGQIKVWGNQAKGVDTIVVSGTVIDTANSDTIDIKVGPYAQDSIANYLTGIRHLKILAGNNIADIDQDSLLKAIADSELVYIADTSGPLFDSAYYDAGAKKFTIWFDEVIDHTPCMNLDLSKLRVHTKGQTDYTYFTGATDTIPADVDSAFFILTPAQDKAIQDIYWATAKAVTDTMIALDVLSGVAMDIGYHATLVDSLNCPVIYGTDGTDPDIDTSGVYPNLCDETKAPVLTTLFNEYVKVDSVDLAKWVVKNADKSDSVNLISATDTAVVDTTADSMIVKITVTSAQDDAIRGFGGPAFLWIRTAGVKDMSGRTNADIDSIEIELAPDSIPPYLLSTGSWYNHYDSLLVLKFSEAVYGWPRTMIKPEKVHISDAVSKSSITLTYGEIATTTNTDSAFFELTGGHRDSISAWRAGGANKLYVTVDSSAFQDIGSNFILDEVDSLETWYPDTHKPYIQTISWSSIDTLNTSYGVGDTIIFKFHEPMNKSTVTASNVNDRLKIKRSGGSYGSAKTLPTVIWNDVGDTCQVILGSGFNLSSPDSVDPTDDVMDIGGNSDSTYIFVDSCTIVDAAKPFLKSIEFVNTDGPDDTKMTKGDQLIFHFSEAMDSSRIDSSNAETYLPEAASGRSGFFYDCDTVGLFSWATDLKSITITLGDTFNIRSNAFADGDSVNPLSTSSDSVCDAYGNLDSTYTAVPILEDISPISRTVETVDTIKILAVFNEILVGTDLANYWRVTIGAKGVEPDSVTVADDSSRYLWTDPFATGATPFVEYVTTSGYCDSSKNYIQPYSTNAKDRIKPTFTAQTAPGNLVVLAFSEPIQGDNTPGAWKTEGTYTPSSMSGVDSTTRRILHGCQLGTDSTYVQYIGTPGNLKDYADVPNLVAAAGVYAKAGSPPDSAPTALDAYTVGSDEIDMTWLDNSTNEEGFEISRKDSATGAFAVIDSAGEGAQFYADIGLEADHWYWYKVRAYNIFGSTAYTNIDSAKTETGTVSFDIPLVPSWNMVSIPVTLTETNLDSIFKQNNEIWTYVPDTGYTTPDNAELGVGYWVDWAGVDTTITVTGMPEITYTKSLTTGWNMIGSVSDTVPISDVGVVPAGGIDTMALWWYEPGVGYIHCNNTIFPTKGYWIEALVDCDITVEKGAKVVVVSVGTSTPEPLWTVELKVESNGIEEKLTFGTANTAISKTLPPLPPTTLASERILTASSILDAHFQNAKVSGRCVTDIREPSANEWNLTVNADEFTVSWDRLDIPENMTVTLSAGDKTIDMRNVTSVSLTDVSTIKFSVSDRPEIAIPKKFALLQNRPNPFAKETRISLHLPVNAPTTVAIYNLSGQKVKTLVDENMKAGYHALTWNGTNDSGKRVASGIYFYKAQAGKFTAVKKLTIMK